MKQIHAYWLLHAGNTISNEFDAIVELSTILV